jgi:hypothetical protein
MQTAPAGFFSPDVNTMDGTSKYPFFPAGFIGRVKVSACKGITRRNGERAFIAELDVLSSNLPNVQVGGRYSWFQSLKEPGTAYPACIAFLYACLGLDSGRDKAKIEIEIKPRQDAYLNAAVNENPALYGGKTNVLAGAEIMLQTSSKKTKNNTDFTLHAFSAAPAAKAA